jgi:hypothetical protein
MRSAVAETSLEMPYPAVDDKDCGAGLINAGGAATTRFETHLSNLDDRTIDDDLSVARGIGLGLLISSMLWSLIGLGLWFLF